jgi:hypothetical protein
MFSDSRLGEILIGIQDKQTYWASISVYKTYHDVVTHLKVTEKMYNAKSFRIKTWI